MLDGLRRITRDGRWIREIDSLRFIAIISVFLFHLNGELLLGKGRHISVQSRYSLLSAFIHNGDRGVRLFFVISGFILAVPFARQLLKNGQKVSIGRYFLRRLSRLEPPYILHFVIAVLLFGILTHGSGITLQYLAHVAAGIVYLHNPIFHATSPVNVVTWSLEVEIQFYILAPLFAVLYRIRSKAQRRGLILSLMALCGIMQAAFIQSDSCLQFSIAFYAQYFLAGFLLADFYLLELDGHSSGWWDVFGIVGWCAYFLVPFSPSAHGLFPFLLLALCASALCTRHFRGFFSNPTIAVIGGMCYSIYLLHYLFIAAVFRFTRNLVFPSDYFASLLIQILVTGVPALLACVAYFALVERFFMDPAWPSRMATWLRRRTHAQPEMVVK